MFWIEKKYKYFGDKRFADALKKASRAAILDSIAKFAAAEGKRGEKVCGMAILKVLNHKRQNRFGEEAPVNEE
ncbi:MAG: hypothetical protein EBR40_11485 [Proteobacteria bacterium]|nr:hypothetical protein [Pseudomonadota bacterium]